MSCRCFSDVVSSKKLRILGINELSYYKHVLFHPSQNVKPSNEDISVTQRLVECGRILGIEVLDHIIVNAKAEYYSMKEKGQM
ncbi:JAB domain-containing protein [Mesobacillus foraminis]|uniref:JAB domain-containing protein n=1 Tax=Mesobacillus foraminis TaxID=279826 RepID=UPI002551DD0C|nr:JAB domain-containing protein [Mesobacillus foraminis]